MVIAVTVIECDRDGVRGNVTTSCALDELVEKEHFKSFTQHLHLLAKKRRRRPSEKRMPAVIHAGVAQNEETPGFREREHHPQQRGRARESPKKAPW